MEWRRASRKVRENMHVFFMYKILSLMVIWFIVQIAVISSDDV